MTERWRLSLCLRVRVSMHCFQLPSAPLKANLNCPLSVHIQLTNCSPRGQRSTNWTPLTCPSPSVNHIHSLNFISKPKNERTHFFFCNHLVRVSDLYYWIQCLSKHRYTFNIQQQRGIQKQTHLPVHFQYDTSITEQEPNTDI